MRVILCVLIAALALVGATSVFAQQDSLVVDENGRVGVGTLSPTESVNVIAALEAPFEELPAECQQNVRVRILIVDAETLETLVMTQGRLNETSRVLRAELPPGGSESLTVQVAVLTRPSLTDCLTAETTAVGAAGEIRKLDC